MRAGKKPKAGKAKRKREQFPWRKVGFESQNGSHSFNTTVVSQPSSSGRVELGIIRWR